MYFSIILLESYESSPSPLEKIKPDLYELEGFKAIYCLEKVREVHLLTEVDEGLKFSMSAKIFNLFFKREVLYARLQWALLQCWFPHDVNDSTGELS